MLLVNALHNSSPVCTHAHTRTSLLLLGTTILASFSYEARQSDAVWEGTTANRVVMCSLSTSNCFCAANVEMSPKSRVARVPPVLRVSAPSVDLRPLYSAVLTLSSSSSRATPSASFSAVSRNGRRVGCLGSRSVCAQLAKEKADKVASTHLASFHTKPEM